MTRIGEILSELREERGLTQHELAEALHISNSSISAYETGSRMPNIETVIAYVRYFDVTSDYLLGLSNSLISPSALLEELHNGVIVGDIVAAMRKLRPNQRAALLTVLHDMSIYADLADKTEQSEGQ